MSLIFFILFVLVLNEHVLVRASVCVRYLTRIVILDKSPKYGRPFFQAPMVISGTLYSSIFLLMCFVNQFCITLGKNEVVVVVFVVIVIIVIIIIHIVIVATKIFVNIIIIIICVVVVVIIIILIAFGNVIVIAIIVVITFRLVTTTLTIYNYPPKGR